MEEFCKFWVSLTTWPLSSRMTAHEATLGLSSGALRNVPRPTATLTTDERYSVPPGPLGKAALLHSLVPQPRGLFTLMETHNLIWQDGSVLLPLLCAAGSLLHAALPDRLFTCLACLHCAESQNKIFQSLHICYVMVAPREGLADVCYPFVVCSFVVTFD